ncbi:Transcriptional activator [Lasiodiplodia theobromae]|uniref:Transcriptional activator n=1 Tax=Lasiodiplodia theobromae TaxID=45133 RepID=UPI0015C2C2DD|nr:Transcriptional activator [Lasiodiplodia theobromae]KAF4537655.1 Transcriptional activator [Lasiodiplodia theobromae]
MGRLVLNHQQVPMFAGSSTGVHFISQAEQKLQILKIHPESLPSEVYSLYLNSLCNAPPVDPVPHIAASFVAQFPLNAESLIEQAIDCWTPLYPVIHKQSTIDAFRSLLNNPSNGDLCTVYQTLILLALGSIGSPSSACPKPHHHHHFLCLSEHYYALSTALATKILERPCLAALQGLVLAQVYLQLSSRYPAASHLSGTAVRLAQTLGLHRHSARFKFDALQTELRRRAWWSVYALDAFASAHHGMPRLIRDQDVDADLPTRVDYHHESGGRLLPPSQQQQGSSANVNSPLSSFPLPGERSPIDTAIALFKLAAIVGDALEQLYTTTRRRGGARKIARLQADLDVWEQHYLAPLSSATTATTTATGIGDTATEAEEDGESPPSPTPPPSLPTLFLRAALCNATIHVHRPALAFTTTTTEQFGTSLRACVRASVALIRRLDEAMMQPDDGGDEGQQQLQQQQQQDSVMMAALLYPNGLHMLWQAGLTVLFARWHGVVGAAVDEDDSTGDDEAVVVRCAAVLRRLVAVGGGGGSGIGGDGGEENVRRCADVLDMLRVKTFGRGSNSGRREQEERGEEEGGGGRAAGSGWTTRQGLSSPIVGGGGGLSLPLELPQWNVWDWPMASALELANTLDAVPLDLDFDGGNSLW